MTKTLWLYRHAKSDHDVDLDDHNRPLNSRGKKACKIIGNFLAYQSCLPDHIFSSSSLRTTETIKRTLETAQLNIPVTYDKKLYLASPGEIITFLTNNAQETNSSVMIVGHNPGLQQLTMILTPELPKPYKHEISKKFPTSCLVKLTTLVDSWQKLEPGVCSLEHYVTPKLIRM